MKTEDLVHETVVVEILPREVHRYRHEARAPLHERLLERVHLAQDVAVEHRYLIVPFEHGHERPLTRGAIW